MSETQSRTVVVAGALIPPQWLPGDAIRARLPALAERLAARHVLGIEVDLPGPPRALPNELAHDAWLRTFGWPGNDGPPPEPGTMTAIRRVAGLPVPGDGWLLEPVHFRLARDHLLLDTRITPPADLVAAERLTAPLRPLLDAMGLDLHLLAPGRWWLTARTPVDRLVLMCASAEAAAGRNVAGYLPSGADERRYRRLLNEIQMTWFAAASAEGDRDGGGNDAQAGGGAAAPINSVWLSGPVSAAACAGWARAMADGSLALDDRLLDARLNEDRGAWLDALASLDEQLAAAVGNASPERLLLCGDDCARWLAPASGPPAGTRPGGSRPVARLGEWLRRKVLSSAPAGALSTGATPHDDPIAALFADRRPERGGP